MTDPHEMFEAFVADAIAQSPEPLKELGKFLSEQLGEDAWKTADRLLLQIAAQPHPSQQAGTEAMRAAIAGAVLPGKMRRDNPALWSVSDVVSADVLDVIAKAILAALNPSEARG